MFKKALIVGISVLSFAVAGSAFAAGAENIVLKGGALGDVHFPHKLHQKTLHNCKACHKLFAKKKGAIQADIESGKLKKKEVMKNCETCHKEYKAKGEKTGPIKCRDCHKKEKK